MSGNRPISGSYWPEFYEGEILYSTIARFVRRIGGLTTEAIHRELLGLKSYRYSIDLPTRIDHLASRINLKHYSSLDIIHKHTLYNYYASFYDESERKDLLRYMRSFNPKVEKSFFGRKSPVGPVTHMRFCRECCDAMIERHGEPYWRREHQVPTIRVCLEHGKLLSSSAIFIGGGGLKYVPLTKTTEAVDQGLSRADVTDEAFDQLLRIARISKECLDGHRKEIPTKLFNQYRSALHERGFSRSNRARISNVMLEQSASIYADKVALIWPNISSTNHDQEKWFKIPIRTRNCRTHPAYHILFQDFINQIEETEVDGVPSIFRGLSIDWPCCNPFVVHETKPKVKFLDYRKTSAGTRVKFQCDCGCIYNKTQSHDGHFGKPVIISYGPALVDQIVRVKRDGLSVRELCEKVGIIPATFYSHARKLGMSFSTSPQGPRKN